VAIASKARGVRVLSYLKPGRRNLEVRNAVTGQRFEILYGADGRRVITSRDGKPGEVGDFLAVSELSLPAQSAAYEIRGGRIITMLGGHRLT